MTVLLMRHAEPDWAQVDGAGWRGAANDLAPLTALGRQQASDAAEALRNTAPTQLLSSPMTRALQTAAVIAGVLRLDVDVRLGLREWLPDHTYQWTTGTEVMAAYDDMIRSGGSPASADITWEPLAAVRSRAMTVLQPFVTSNQTVLAVCHEVLIHALTGHSRTAHTQMRQLPVGRSAGVSHG